MSIEQVVKGEIRHETLDVAEPGGVYGDRRTVIPGIPQFKEGDRYLLFLVRTDEGIWRVLDFALGKFHLQTDRSAREVAVREDVNGWDPDGKVHMEQNRAAEPFLNFVRGTLKGGPAAENYILPVQAESVELGRASAVHALSTFSPTTYTYLWDGGTGAGARWNTFPSAVNFFSTNANAAAITAMNNAIAAWNNDAASNVNLVNAGVDASGTHTGGPFTPDQQNTVAFEVNLVPFGASAFSCGSNSYGGTLGVGGVTHSTGSHVGPNSETFDTADEGDVDMNQGLSTCSFFIGLGDFNSAVAHELGHTLGFRHADQERASLNAPSCASDATVECSTSAIMKATVPSALHGSLQAWDQHAVDAVYPAPLCTSPSISVQPANVTITTGQSTTLSVTASGTAPLTYQWYQGTSGITTTPVGGGTGNQVTVSPTVTTSYWVQVGGCGTSVNSSTATVTVTQPACPIVTISTAPGACLTSTQNTASAISASSLAGSAFAWSITNGTITGGAGTATITFQPTAAGAVTLQVTVTSTGCSTSPSKSVNALTCGGSGDTNGDGTVGAGDIFYLINNLFAGGPAPAGGTGDANGNGSIEPGDIFYLVNFLFAGGQAPR